MSVPADSLLAGIRTVSLAVNLPGPVAASRFTSLGAHVTKVEPPSGDPLRIIAPDWYEELARGQDARVLDLKDEGARSELEELLAQTDLLLTSSRPGALTRLGLCWADLSARLPRLCQVAIVGYPALDDNLAGHDLTYQAAAGTLSPPMMPTVPIADLAGAERAVSERAVSEGLAAILHRDATGTATYREVALSEVCQDLSQPVRCGTSTPDGVLGGALPTYGIYDTASGYVALAALEPHFWQRVVQLLKVSDSREELETVFLTRTATDWEEWARAHDLPLSAVRSPGTPR